MRYPACSALLLVASSACLLPMEQTDPIDATRDRKSSDPPAPLEVRALASSSKRLVVLGKRSTLTVSGHDSVMGDHALTFDRWVAHIEPGPPLKLVVDIDLRSLRSSENVVESIVKDHLLEVHKHGHAFLVATLTEATGDGGVVIDGTADIHGTKGPIRFTGKIQPEGDAMHFEASFPMSRRAFGLNYAPVEPFLDDSFRVTVNAVAAPERVTAEQVD